MLLRDAAMRAATFSLLAAMLRIAAVSDADLLTLYLRRATPLPPCHFTLMPMPCHAAAAERR